MSWLFQPLLPAADLLSSEPSDLVPDPFTFTDQIGVARNTEVISNTITVTGINNDTPLSITGGSYSINGGAYQTAANTVAGGETITLKHTSSSSYNTVTNTTLTIGGVSDTFSSTTEAEPGTAIGSMMLMFA